MTSRGFYTLLACALMLTTALSVGSAAAFLVGAAALAALLVALLSVLAAFLTCRLSQQADAAQLMRGEQLFYALSVRMMTLIPVAPLSLHMKLPSGRESDFLLSADMIGETVSESAFTCPHVGVCEAGVTHVTVSDCFSLFSLRRRVKSPLASVTVLPNPVPTQPPAFSPGEGEHSAAQRAQADPTTPVDTRLWQDGDEMRRVHWKLSMRKQTLMVHTYETPQRPDALILLDCAAPDCLSQHRAAMIDAMTESCAGVVKALLDAGHAVRLPLCGRTARELSAQDANALSGILCALAQEPFDAPAEFERVLMLSARRMRRTGATRIFATRLTPRIADAAIALSRMGPRTSFTLVTDHPADERQEKLLHLLRASGVEAEHICAA